MKTKHAVETVNDQKSEKAGWAGSFETTLRKFRNLSYLLTLLPIVVLYAACIGLALAPGVFIYEKAQVWLAGGSASVRAIGLGLVGGSGFVVFMATLIFVIPLFNLPFLPFVKPYRGPWFSLETIPWFYHNALTYLARYTVLNLMTPTPVTLLFYRMMGMKIGKHVVLNTANISDPCLVEIGDYATIGGSVYMMAHYGQKGFLIVGRLKIGKGANIGLHSYLMGDVEVGEGAMVMPNTAVLPKTVIAPGSRFGG